jgi:hypothetical protein
LLSFFHCSKRQPGQQEQIVISQTHPRQQQLRAKAQYFYLHYDLMDKCSWVARVGAPGSWEWLSGPHWPCRTCESTDTLVAVPGRMTLGPAWCCSVSRGRVHKTPLPLSKWFMSNKSLEHVPLFCNSCWSLISPQAASFLPPASSSFSVVSPPGPCHFLLSHPRSKMTMTCC